MQCYLNKKTNFVHFLMKLKILWMTVSNLSSLKYSIYGFSSHINFMRVKWCEFFVFPFIQKLGEGNQLGLVSKTLNINLIRLLFYLWNIVLLQYHHIWFCCYLYHGQHTFTMVKCSWLACFQQGNNYFIISIANPVKVRIQRPKVT